ncbi:mevalonate kinase [Enterococcus sp. PF1-24]|uniref:mevalonate kinase n=1 Tax=unclassified Enterococcus TaxID=2608891 RepID=UPI0024755217|nr:MULTISPECIES: mevalonate kinase [unclassified Enterococcus]MDH6363946.1 mevalonate kinase [Enterococcus sp. PFB1-1]MDH6401047.1 mevalonate kinase [Enterococcus sp. PF1-24]
MKLIGKGVASGKIILMGEHAVVYGQPAIAMPFLATQIKAEITAAPENQLISSYYQGLLAKVPQALKNLVTLVYALQLHFADNDGLQITIESNIPAERGMGSSAAVAVAITRAYFDYQETALSEKDLLAFVNLSEKVAHGNPSGIDAAATSGPNPLYFIRGEELATFPMNIDAYLIVADTGIKGQTRQAVADVAELYQQNATIEEVIQNLGKLTKTARQEIIANQPHILGELMTKAHHCLQQLTISNTSLDQLVDVALAHGALGAKLTGGGRGGCLIALASDLTSAEKIAAAQKQAGAKNTWIQGLGGFA